MLSHRIFLRGFLTVLISASCFAAPHKARQVNSNSGQVITHASTTAAAATTAFRSTSFADVSGKTGPSVIEPTNPTATTDEAAIGVKCEQPDFCCENPNICGDECDGCEATVDLQDASNKSTASVTESTALTEATDEIAIGIKCEQPDFCCNHSTLCGDDCDGCEAVLDPAAVSTVNRSSDSTSDMTTTFDTSMTVAGETTKSSSPSTTEWTAEMMETLGQATTAANDEDDLSNLISNVCEDQKYCCENKVACPDIDCGDCSTTPEMTTPIPGTDDDLLNLIDDVCADQEYCCNNRVACSNVDCGSCTTTPETTTPKPCKVEGVCKQLTNESLCNLNNATIIAKFASKCCRFSGFTLKQNCSLVPTTEFLSTTTPVASQESSTMYTTSDPSTSMTDFSTTADAIDTRPINDATGNPDPEIPIDTTVSDHASSSATNNLDGAASVDSTSARDVSVTSEADLTTSASLTVSPDDDDNAAYDDFRNDEDTVVTTLRPHTSSHAAITTLPCTRVPKGCKQKHNYLKTPKGITTLCTHISAWRCCGWTDFSEEDCATRTTAVAIAQGATGTTAVTTAQGTTLGTTSRAHATNAYSDDYSSQLQSGIDGAANPPIKEGSSGTFLLLLIIVIGVVCFVYRDEIKSYINKGGNGTYTRPSMVPNQAYEQVPLTEDRESDD